MTAQDLLQYRNLKKEVEDLERKIKKMESENTFTAGEKAVILELWENTKSNCIGRLIDVENFVQEIDDSELRQIFRYRYIDGHGWVRIAANLEREVYPESVKKRVQRFWGNF